MRPPATAIFLFPVFCFLTSIAGDDYCNPDLLPDPLTLRSDQLTVLINGFSERRLPLLRTLVAGYSTHPAVFAVLVLWGNPTTPAHLLRFPSPVTVHRHPTASLNARFLPRPTILTRAVAVCDDDIELHPAALSLAFNVWRGRQESLVGFFARSHDFDLSRRTWIYTVHPERYSIILTKMMIMKTEYLSRYSCDEKMWAARRVVDEGRNCEDILMNFVAAMEGGEAVVVDGRRVRDWGDPRNGGSGNGTEEEEMRRVGLSSVSDHRRRRGECIVEFHRLLGRMPLRYSYGKVVEGVGEQGLCRKGGKLVSCDQQQQN